MIIQNKKFMDYCQGVAVGFTVGVAVVVGFVVLVAFGLAVGVALAFGVVVAEAACLGPVITRTDIFPVSPTVAVAVPNRSESAFTISETIVEGTSEEY